MTILLADRNNATVLLVSEGYRNKMQNHILDKKTVASASLMKKSRPPTELVEDGHFTYISATKAPWPAGDTVAGSASK
jgi:hypothetical protein